MSAQLPNFFKTSSFEFNLLRFFGKSFSSSTVVSFSILTSNSAAICFRKSSLDNFRSFKNFETVFRCLMELSRTAAAICISNDGSLLSQFSSIPVFISFINFSSWSLLTQCVYSVSLYCTAMFKVQ